MTQRRQRESGYVPSQPERSDDDVAVAPMVASRTAMDQLSTLTNRATEGVSGLEQEEDGWLFQIEMVELERIPESTSVLATYETHTDEAGNVMAYKRTRRYTRNQAGDL